MPEPVLMIDVLEERLVKARERLAQLEELAESAKGPPSEPFVYRMTEARSHCDHLEDRIKALRLKDALDWTPDTRRGLLQICEEIGHRLDELFGHFEKRRS